MSPFSAVPPRRPRLIVIHRWIVSRWCTSPRTRPRTWKALSNRRSWSRDPTPATSATRAAGLSPGPTPAYKVSARAGAAKPLRAALVTVSACRSAGERTYSGEGLVGFAWAFLRAGASRVIAGLWDVDDRSTAELMEHLYARIAAGDPAARALRTAKLALLAKGGVYAKPYYWAPFQVFTVIP